VPANLWEKTRRDFWSETQQSLANEEATRLASLNPGTSITIHYDLTVESGNLGEIVTCLMLAKYLARAEFPVEFVLSTAESNGRYIPHGTESFDSRQIELQSVARQLSNGEFALTVRESQTEKDKSPDPVSYTLFEDHIRSRTAIIHAVLSVFNNPKFFKKFGDPKDLVDWEPSGYIGWHVRHSKANSARNYYSETLLVKDAQVLARNFPDSEIRVFTDGQGRQHFQNVASRNKVLSQMLTQEKITFQLATDFIGAATEAAGCEFWFQRLGGGINLFPLFSAMPFLILSEDYLIRKLVASTSSSLYSWHEPSQKWLVPPDAAFRALPTRYLA